MRLEEAVCPLRLELSELQKASWMFLFPLNTNMEIFLLKLILWLHNPFKCPPPPVTAGKQQCTRGFLFSNISLVKLYRCLWVSAKESNLMPCGDEHPRSVEVGELCEIHPDIIWGPPQDWWILTLSVEDAPCSPVVHVSPKRCHNSPVPGNWKSYRCELGHFPQERHEAVVVNLGGGGWHEVGVRAPE